MGEAFIRYGMYEVGKKIEALRQDVTGRIESLCNEIGYLVDRARAEGADRFLVQGMVDTLSALNYLRNLVDHRLKLLAERAGSVLEPVLRGFDRSRVCTDRELAELVGRLGEARALIECYGRNIVACRDVTEEFITLEGGARAVEVVYLDLDGTPRRSTVFYRPGSERVRGAFYPVVPAAYERCLGIRVEVEGEKQPG